MNVNTYLEALGLRLDENWVARIATRNGQAAMVVVTRGPEIHIVQVERTSLSRRNIIEALQPLFDQYGYATTRVPLDVTDHKLREHLGFTRQWDDDRFSYWTLTEMPYKRKERACLSSQ